MIINDLFEYRAGHSLPRDVVQLMDPDPVDVAGNPQAGDLAGPNAQFHEQQVKEESLQGIDTSYDWEEYNNKEGPLRDLLNQPRNYPTQNYTGTPTEGPEDSVGPDLEPFYTQMKNPISPGARFDKNFGVEQTSEDTANHRVIDEYIEEVYEATDGDQIYDGLKKVFPNVQATSLTDLISKTIRPLLNLGSRNSRAGKMWIDTLYNFVRVTPGTNIGRDNFRALETAALDNDINSAMKMLDRSEKKSYRVLEAPKKSTPAPRNPVARAAQRVARGSGTHKNPKSYQRQPKHRNR